MGGDLLGQVRPGEHTDARLGSDLLDDLAHQLEGLRLDAFGGADQLFAGQQPGHRLQHLTQRARGQRHERQLARLQCRRQIGGRLHAVEHLDTL